MARRNADDADTGIVVEHALETRTTGSEGQSCRRCGGPINGRRRNGYCSDRCRMRNRREQNRARLAALLQRLEDDLRALRDELVEEVEA
jgi:predicted nucleic acid-binding Zn ribbon protein